MLYVLLACLNAMGMFSSHEIFLTDHAIHLPPGSDSNRLGHLLLVAATTGFGDAF